MKGQSHTIHYCHISYYFHYSDDSWLMTQIWPQMCLFPTMDTTEESWHSMSSGLNVWCWVTRQRPWLGFYSYIVWENIFTETANREFYIHRGIWTELYSIMDGWKEFVGLMENWYEENNMKVRQDRKTDKTYQLTLDNLI